MAIKNPIGTITTPCRINKMTEHCISPGILTGIEPVNEPTVSK